MPKVKVTPKRGTEGFRGTRARKATTSSAAVTSSRRTKRRSEDSETGPQSKRQRLLRDGTHAVYSAHNMTASGDKSRSKGKQRQTFSGTGGKRGSGSSSFVERERPSQKKKASVVDPSGTESSGTESSGTESSGSESSGSEDAGPSRGSTRSTGTGKAAPVHKRKEGDGQTKTFSGTGGKRGSGSYNFSERERPSRTKRASVVDPSGTESSGTESSVLEEAGPSSGSTRSREKRKSSVGGGVGPSYAARWKSPVKKTVKASTSFRRTVSDGDTTAESEGEKGRASVRELTVSSAKWQPVSEESCKVLSTAMLSALGQCVTELSGSRRRQAEHELQEVTSRVMQKLQSAIGPTAGRMKSYSGVKQNVAELKETCLRLVRKNSELEQSLDNRERVTTDLQDKTDQLLDAVSSAPAPPGLAEFPDPPVDADTDEDAFMNYVADLAEKGRVASSRSGRIIC